MRKVMYSSAVLATLFFLYLSQSFAQPMWTAFDQEVQLLLQGHELISVFYYVGEPAVAVIVGVLLVLYFALRGKDYRAMLFVVLVFAGGNALNQLLKQIFQRIRPEIINQLTTYSFPSGHTMAGFFTVMSVAYFLTRNSGSKNRFIIWGIAILLAILVGLSRIAQGHHFATDVLGGWFIGYAWLMLCIWWYERRKEVIKKG